MGVNFKTCEKTLVAFIQGEVDHHTATSMRFAIDKAMASFECINLIMDISEVNFMDSSGIGLILGRYKKISRKSGKVYIAGCHRHLEKLLTMSNVFSVVPKFDSYEDALCEINGEAKLEMEVVNE